MTDRFSVKYGKFGAYFFDEHKKKELSLEDVKELLNEYIPPGLPKPPSFIDSKTDAEPITVKPITMNGNAFSIFSGAGFR